MESAILMGLIDGLIGLIVVVTCSGFKTIINRIKKQVPVRWRDLLLDPGTQWGTVVLQFLIERPRSIPFEETAVLIQYHLSRSEQLTIAGDITKIFLQLYTDPTQHFILGETDE